MMKGGIIIKFNIKLSGQDDLFKKLDKMAKRGERLSASDSIQIDELLTDRFIASNSHFSNLKEFIEVSGFDFDELSTIPQKELDVFVRKNTNCNSWEKLKQKALFDYVTK